MSTCFNESTINAKISTLQELIHPYAVGAEGETSGTYSFLTNGATQFNQGFTDLKSLVTKRYNTVNSCLSTITVSPTPVVSTKPSATLTPVPPTTSGYKISGYVAPDSNSNSSSVKADFKVEITGAGLSATTDNNGYYQINNVPASSSGYTVRVTKTNFLSKDIKNVVVNNSDVQLRISTSPIHMWAGDIAVNRNQDNAINMNDIMIFAGHFNRIPSDYGNLWMSSNKYEGSAFRSRNF